MYHVNGEGQDGGVVFSEMKSRLSSPEIALVYEAAHLLFPGQCGYKWETGGSVKNLRTETNNEKIRRYHEKFYRPENMLVIVGGRVEKEALFEAIQPVEAEEEAKDRDEFEKPFQTPCPALPGDGTIEKEVEYPDGK